MALPPTGAEEATPSAIELIKACREDTNICGRMRRHRLAAIAAELGIEASNKPWVGHVLSLSCESLEKRSINEILKNGHGIYKKQWDKWKLGEDDPQWEGRKGEDKIQDLVYSLLLKDLIKLYQGYEFDGGKKVKGLSVKGVCEKVKAETGIVIIKDTHLGDRLKLAGVKRDLKGQVQKGKKTQSECSPNTSGWPTPTSVHTASGSPRPKLEGRVSPAGSNTSSSRSIPKGHAYISGGTSSQLNNNGSTLPSRHHALKSTNYFNQSRTTSPSNMTAFQHNRFRNAGDTTRSSKLLGEELGPAPMSGNEMSIGMEDLSENGQLIPTSPHLVPSTGGSPNIINPYHDVPVHTGGAWPTAEQLCHPDEARLLYKPSKPARNFSFDNRHPIQHSPFPHPLVLTAETPSNNTVTQISEQLKLLNDRFNSEKAAREAQASEIDKWKNKYAADVRHRYEALYQNQELRIKDLEQAKIGERTRSEKLSNDMETLQQKHDGLDASVQSLKNSNGELQSKVLELHSENLSRAEHINDLQNTLNRLTARNNELEGDLSALHGNNNSLVKQLGNLRSENAKFQTANERLHGVVKEIKDEKLKVENNLKVLVHQKHNLEKGVSKLQAMNDKLKAQVDQFQADADEALESSRLVEVLQQDKATLQEEVDHLQAVVTGLNAQVTQLQQTKAIFDAELTNKRTVEQQQKDSIQDESNTLRAENTKLNAQTTQLQKILASLDGKVALLERERASLQEESKSPSEEIHLAHQSFSRFSNLTFDSAIGDSVRGSYASSRKRQSSLTDEHEKKRHRDGCNTERVFI